jgi:co-chaperonin GroES (HSP10)
MRHRSNAFSLKVTLCAGLICAPVSFPSHQAFAQAPASSAAARQLGTVKSITGNTIALSTDAGQNVTVTASADTKVLKLAAGSTDLKTAQPSQLSDVAVGDRLLATGTAGQSPTVLTASRIILMKSSDIAQKNAAEQSQWRVNGVAGIVSAVDPGTGTISLASGTNKYAVTTTGTTVFKRFAGDSTKYQDAKTGALADIHVGDQMQARGQKSADGLSVKAEEVLSGSFKNLSGLIITADPAAGAITLKDLATKKIVTVNVTPNTNVRNLPPQMAQMFAGRTSGASGGQFGGARGQGAGRGAPGGGAGPAGPGGQRGGSELSQMINRLPTQSLADMKKGDAVMIVATEPTPEAATLTAITLLTGVEPILTANPNGGMDLSGWSMGEGPGAGAE